MKPALTPEEWGADPLRQVIRPIWFSGTRTWGEDRAFANPLAAMVEPECPKDRHVLAALALYDQPFGFTHEDVRRLRHLAADEELTMPLAFDWGFFGSLADRIEALLPPEQTPPLQPLERVLPVSTEPPKPDAVGLAFTNEDNAV